jgi:hypothetical protein
MRTYWWTHTSRYAHSTSRGELNVVMLIVFCQCRQFPEVSINEMDIFNCTDNAYGIREPYITVVSRFGDKISYPICNSSTGDWPLSYDNPEIGNLAYVRNFMQDLGR